MHKLHKLTTKTRADCCNDITMVIPQTQDFARTSMIKHDFRRKTNMEDSRYAQLAVLACALFCRIKKTHGKNTDRIPG